MENKTNSKFITPDDKLKFLLGLEEGQELTYFNIQKYMNKHNNLENKNTNIWTNFIKCC